MRSGLSTETGLNVLCHSSSSGRNLTVSSLCGADVLLCMAQLWCHRHGKTCSCPEHSSTASKIQSHLVGFSQGSSELRHRAFHLQSSHLSLASQKKPQPKPKAQTSIQLLWEVAGAAGGVGGRLPSVGDALALSWSCKFWPKSATVAARGQEFYWWWQCEVSSSVGGGNRRSGVLLVVAV